MRRVAPLLLALLAPLPGRAEPAAMFRDCAACPLMAPIPPGTVRLGDTVTVTLAAPYALSATEITFDHYAACVAQGACPGGQDDHGWGRGARPVINLDLAAVTAYTDWLTARSGHPYRLPSEAEWVHGARAGTDTAYWWGEEIGAGRANTLGSGSPWSGQGSAPVGTFPANPWGLFDTVGNVLEWTADCWAPTVAHHPRDGRPLRQGDCTSRALRGGAWYYIAAQARVTARNRQPAGAGSYTVGFRVLREGAPP
ncbi:formylglycine-generating enzyme family protein [Roseospirillum parvum]|uniref:Formylglycine-generating enzyme, required for sulfatase activity, contains SUMF1/FGE domain n=1 Tax=Roseospirillum parvum TaxID=83401 RepID=A0A1G7UJ45_9PROT|nr:SUMF1/EgtB/PvdO family nonheme iron enzyme [Roseospirillum parvum]SDG47271.1 Formylglycine-generating enzyme, required for sulfatase activity, contains SUMF1/FGE domain [Roseospirillum parvum]